MRISAAIFTVTATLAVTLQPVAAQAADEDEKFQVTDVIVDPNGTTHTRMERTFKGLRVLGGDVVRHEAETGTYSSLTLRAKPKPEKAKISAKEAAEKALFGGFKSDGKGELIYEARNSAGEPRLAWRWMVGGQKPDGTPVKTYVSVDALSGKVLLREEAVKTELGDGRSLYGGTVPLQTTKTGSTYELKDPTRGNTYTVDSANGTDFCIFIFCLWRAPANKITDADNHWADGTAANRATVAVDAQYGTSVTWDFYQTAFGRSGIKNDGKGSFNRVHYGNNYANAFWDDTCFCMTYGDGDGSRLGPLTSLDVAAHEMSHGVTSATANLAYSGESGGLNEATSDILASSVEFHAANGSDPGDYLIGERIVLPGFGRNALRYMDKPSKDTKSPDYWSPTLKDLDVHYSSGVANHFFYLLSEGSGAKVINGVAHDSPTFDGVPVTGIGRDAAVRIWYKALTTYMTSNTNYAGARTATLSAAADLFGSGSPQQLAVAAAWKAVNVN